MVEKVQKEYPISAPDYLVDDKQIIKDLGIYKTYKFKKTPNRG
jgi:predicted transcriptional regulator